MGLDDRLRRLEREPGGEPKCPPIPPDERHALDVILDLRREDLWNPAMSASELERMLIDRGVGALLAHDLAFYWPETDG